MMFSPAPDRSPLTRGERWTFAIMLLLVLGFFTADIVTDYSPAKLGGLLVILFWIPLLVTHEAGHALAARLLGWHVGRIVLGFGRTWARLRSGTAVVEVRSVPISGFVMSVPTHLRQPRLRNAIVYFAGPATDLLIAGIIIVIVGPRLLLEPSTHYGMIALQALTIAALADGIMNLIPFSFRENDREIPNDGLGIIMSFRLPDQYFQDQIDAFDEMGPAYFEDPKPEPEKKEEEDWWKRDRRL